MKYLRTEFGDTYIFSDSVTHANMALQLGLKDKSIISAGFLVLEENTEEGIAVIRCGGNSSSLGIKSKPKEDTDFITNEMRRKLTIF